MMLGWFFFLFLYFFLFYFMIRVFGWMVFDVVYGERWAVAVCGRGIEEGRYDRTA